jgi:hypothetical protein
MGMAFHNLARIEIRLGSRLRHIPDPAPMEKALRLGPESTQLYLEAAFLYAIRARSTKDDQDRVRNIDRVFEHLSAGLSRGLTSKELEQVARLYRNLQDDDRWRSLDGMVHPGKPFTPAVLMVDPLDDLRSPQFLHAPSVAQR